MALTLVTTGQSTAGVTSSSVSINIANANSLLVVFVCSTNLNGHESNIPTFNGVAMTPAPNTIIPSFGQGSVGIYYMYNPPTGTNTLAVSGTVFGTMTNVGMGYAVFTGGSSSQLHDSNSNNTSNPSTVTLAFTSGEYTIGISADGSGAAPGITNGTSFGSGYTFSAGIPNAGFAFDYVTANGTFGQSSSGSQPIVSAVTVKIAPSPQGNFLLVM